MLMNAKSVPRNVKSQAKSATRKKARPPATARKAAVPVDAKVPYKSAAPSKQADLIKLLRKAGGASVSQMMALTGWQAHTVRGTISGALRKKAGLTITCVKSANSKEGVYRIVGDATNA